MRYVHLKPYDVLERVAGRPLQKAEQCLSCHRSKGRGDTNLVVRLVDAGPLPDALGVLFGSEWAASGRLAAVIDAAGGRVTRYEPILAETGAVLPYQQVILDQALRTGQESILGGDGCERCGGYVQLSLEPLYLRRPREEPGPLLAFLLESPGVILVRENLARAIAAAQLDVEMSPVLFEGDDSALRA